MLRTYKKKNKVLVIGGSGFLGSNLAQMLNSKGFNVTIYDIKQNVKNSKIRFLRGNIFNIKKLSKAIKGQNYVYFFAGMGDIAECMKNPTQSIKQNILSVMRVLNLCKKYNILRFIFASTIYVHSSQGSFYRVSKKSAELYIEEFSKKNNLKYNILRYGSVYGPNSDKRNNLFNIIYTALKNKKVIYRGTKNSVRKFIHVKDASLASIDILKKKYANQKIVITGKNEVKLSSFCKKLKKEMGLNSPIIYLNNAPGHYDKTPYFFKPEKEIVFKHKRVVNFNKGINELKKHVIENYFNK